MLDDKKDGYEDFSVEEILGEDFVEALREEMRRTKILIPNVEKLKLANELCMKIKELFDENGYEYEIRTNANPLMLTVLHINFISFDFVITPKQVSDFQEIIGQTNGITFSGGREDGKIELGIRIMDAFIDAAAPSREEFD